MGARPSVSNAHAAKALAKYTDMRLVEAACVVKNLPQWLCGVSDGGVSFVSLVLTTNELENAVEALEPWFELGCYSASEPVLTQIYPLSIGRPGIYA